MRGTTLCTRIGLTSTRSTTARCPAGQPSRPRVAVARSRATDSAVARRGGRWRSRSCAARQVAAGASSPIRSAGFSRRPVRTPRLAESVASRSMRGTSFVHEASFMSLTSARWTAACSGGIVDPERARRARRDLARLIRRLRAAAGNGDLEAARPGDDPSGPDWRRCGRNGRAVVLLAAEAEFEPASSTTPSSGSPRRRHRPCRPALG